MAKRRSYKKTSQIEGFAEDLGRLLGTATAKAESWLGQRQTLVKHLTDVRDTASTLLANLGHGITEASFSPGRRRRAVGRKNARVGRPVGSGVRKRRRMSAKARAAISAAQKARWAKQKAGEKK